MRCATSFGTTLLAVLSFAGPALAQQAQGAAGATSTADEGVEAGANAGATSATQGGQGAAAVVDLEEKWAFCKTVRRPRQASKRVRYISPDTLFESTTYSFVAGVPAEGQVLHFSGQIPVDVNYSVQQGTLVEQLHFALKNLCLAMDAAGVTTADIFKVGIHYVHEDAADPFVLAEEMLEFFERDQMPATTMLTVPFLVTEGIRVQVEAVAFLPRKRGKARR